MAQINILFPRSPTADPYQARASRAEINSAKLKLQLQEEKTDQEGIQHLPKPKPRNLEFLARKPSKYD